MRKPTIVELPNLHADDVAFVATYALCSVLSAGAHVAFWSGSWDPLSRIARAGFNSALWQCEQKVHTCSNTGSGTSLPAWCRPAYIVAYGAAAAAAASAAQPSVRVITVDVHGGASADVSSDVPSAVLQAWRRTHGDLHDHVIVAACYPGCNSGSGQVPPAASPLPQLYAAALGARAAVRSGALVTGFDPALSTIRPTNASLGVAVTPWDVFGAPPSWTPRPDERRVASANFFTYIFPTQSGPALRNVTVYDAVSCSFYELPTAIPLEHGATIAEGPGFAVLFGGVPADAAASSRAVLVGGLTHPAGLSTVARGCIDATCPTSLTKAASAIARSKLYVFGGVSGFLKVHGNLWRVDTETMASYTLVAGSNPPEPRYNHGMTSLELNGGVQIGGITDGTWLFVAGGRNANSLVLSDVHAFSATTGRWVRLDTAGSPKLQPVILPCLTASESHLVIVGGVNLVGDTGRISLYGFGRGGWVSNVVKSDLLLDGLGCGRIATSYGSHSGAHRVVVMGSRSAVPIEVTLRTPSCEHGVPTNNATECESCPPSSFREGVRCTDCSTVLPGMSASSDIEIKRACWRSWAASITIGFGLLVMLNVFVTPTTWVVMWMRRRTRTAQRNERAAIRLSHAVARMNLEEVEDLSGIDEPTRVERALAQTAANLHFFRGTIPQATLCMSDALTNFDNTTTRDPESAADLESVRTVDTALQRAYFYKQLPGATASQVGPRGTASVSRSIADGMTSRARWTPSEAALLERENISTVVDSLCAALACGVRERVCAVAVLSIDGLYSWASSQRRAGLAKRISTVHDAIFQAVVAQSGVVDGIVGDKVYASWNSALDCDDAIVHAVRAAHALKHSRDMDVLGLTVAAGVSAGACHVGVLGCSGEDAPPFRHSVVVSKTVAEATNLAAAASALKLGVMVPWAYFPSLEDDFAVRIVGSIRFGSRADKGTYAGEVIAELSELEHHWELKQIAHAAHNFNEIMLRRVQHNETPAEAATVIEGMPQRWAVALRTTMASGSLPNEVVARAW